MGRPKGSKNKPKLPPLPAEPADVECAAPVEPDQEESKATDLFIPEFMSNPIEAMRRYYASFPDFLRDIWKHAIPGGPEPTAIQYDLADFLQHGPPRRIVLGFRGVAKSYMGSAYFAWRLLQNPEERMKYLSGDDDKVSQFSNWTKGLFRLPTFPVLYHLKAKKGQKDDQYMWDVGPASLQQYSTFSGSTANSAIQGGRCTIGMLDDCEQKSNADSETKRAKILKNMLDVSNMLIPESGMDLIVFGTYQTLSSIYITLIRERGFEPFFIPCEVPRDVKEYHGKLAPTIAKMAEDPKLVGTSTEPTRFPIELLHQQKKTIGDLQYQLEWMVSDQHGDRFEHPFPMDRLIVWEAVNPHGAPTKIVPGTAERDKIHDIPFVGLPGDGFYRPSFVDMGMMLPYQQILMAIDPSGSGGKDEAAWIVLGAVPGQIHALTWGGRTNGVDPRTMKEIALCAKNFHVRRIVYEKNMQAWGSLFEQVLKEVGHHCQVEGIHATTVKETRIVNTIEPILYGGQLVVSRRPLEDEYNKGMRSGDARWQERLLQYQLAMFRRNVKGGGLHYDDRVDALALGLSDLHERFLKTGTSDAAAAQKEQMGLEADMEWNQRVWGEKAEEPLWVNARR